MDAFNLKGFRVSTLEEPNKIIEVVHLKISKWLCHKIHRAGAFKVGISRICSVGMRVIWADKLFAQRIIRMWDVTDALNAVNRCDRNGMCAQCSICVMLMSNQTSSHEMKYTSLFQFVTVCIFFAPHLLIYFFDSLSSLAWIRVLSFKTPATIFSFSFSQAYFDLK